MNWTRDSLKLVISELKIEISELPGSSYNMEKADMLNQEQGYSLTLQENRICDGNIGEQWQLFKFPMCKYNMTFPLDSHEFIQRN